jgi:hypothetical protein
MNDHLRRCLAELKGNRQGEIDCHLFVDYVTAVVWPQGQRTPILDPAVERVQEMWQRVLGRPSQFSAGRTMYPLETVRGRATSIFPARNVGWSLGRYVSPDLMIMAASVDAVQRGDYMGVLGEVHFENTIDSAIFASQHPDPCQLMQATAEDTRHEIVVNRQRPKSMWLARTNNALVLPHQWRYQFGDDPPNHPLCRPLPAGMLVVTDTGSAVRVQARDSSIQFDALELFAGPLADEASRLMSEFRPRLPHMARLSLGNLVIARERWNLTPADMPFLRENDPAQQFAEIRAWGRAHGMPRRAFVSSPAERKPWFLDFDSPVSVSILVSRMKKLATGTPVGVTEMLPDLANLWLVDRDEQRFTSELRLVARSVSDCLHL